MLGLGDAIFKPSFETFFGLKQKFQLLSLFSSCYSHAMRNIQEIQKGMSDQIINQRCPLIYLLLDVEACRGRSWSQEVCILKDPSDHI